MTWIPERTCERSCYKTRDAVRLTGCTWRQLDYWTRLGFVLPCEESMVTPGSGFQRTYPAESLLVIELGLSLIRIGFEPKTALRCAKQLADGDSPILADGLVRIGVAS